MLDRLESRHICYRYRGLVFWLAITSSQVSISYSLYSSLQLTHSQRSSAIACKVPTLQGLLNRSFDKEHTNSSLSVPSIAPKWAALSGESRQMYVGDAEVALECLANSSNLVISQVMKWVLIVLLLPSDSYTNWFSGCMPLIGAWINILVLYICILTAIQVDEWLWGYFSQW